MSANDDRLSPGRDIEGDVADDDRFPEDGASNDVTDGAVGRTLHSLEVEFFHPLFVRCDRSTFDAHIARFDCFCCIECHSVVSVVPILDAEVKLLDVQI